MARIGVYYDYFDDKLAPIWLLINFGRGGIEWDRGFVYIPVEAPFNRVYQEDMNEETISVTVSLEHLTLSSDKPGYYGIDLKRLLNQLRKDAQLKHLDLNNVEQLVVQIGDLEELLQMDIREFYVI